MVLDLPYGKKVHEVNPTRNNSTFDKYIASMETVIGSSMEIPKEVLVKKYESTYTAARIALELAGPEDVILVCGSLYILHEAREALTQK